MPLAVPPAYLDRYIGIRDRKKLATRQQLVGIHPHVVNQYAAYSTAAGADQLHTLQPDAICGAASAYLRACYDCPTAALTELIRDIKGAQPARLLKYCPMCGTTIPRTVDHYLPAAVFPEFAVHPLNLVPCCAECNSTKQNDWLSAHGDRYYFHSFCDSIPVDRFLVAVLHAESPAEAIGVTFELRRPPNLANALWQRIESHFARLQLIERYNALSNDEISEQLASCRSHLQAGGQDARAFLLSSAQDLQQAHGENHWRAVLMEALAGFDDLGNLLQVAQQV